MSNAQAPSRVDPRTGGGDIVATAGLLCILGALAGAIGGLVMVLVSPSVPADRFSYPFGTAGHLVAESVFLLNHLLLLIGFVGLRRSGAIGSRVLGRVGIGLAIGGMTLLSACEIGAMLLVNTLMSDPLVAPLEAGYGIATITIGVGLVLAGVAVVRARRWRGWMRWVTLSCGVAVFVVVLPGVFGPMVVGRLVLIVWMLLFAGLGVAMLRDAGGTDVSRSAAS